MESIVFQNEVKNLVTVDQAWYYCILPIKWDEDTLCLVVDQSLDSMVLKDELEIVLGRKLKLFAKPSTEVQTLLTKYYPKGTSQGEVKNANGVVYNINIEGNRFLEVLVKEASDLGSSDIHIETYSDKSRIRFRVDGLLIDRHRVNKAEYPALINKVKIAAGCDIAEKRLPQDGRIRYKVDKHQIDIRVSILPTMYGEKVVLRLLSTDAGHLDIEKLGFSSNELHRYKKAIKKPNGIILISGPTGSGKTTTLYATLKTINKPTNNILTIEDPIEYTLDGINQIQLREDLGLGYPEALKTFLRQDPDVIMLGEIRDPLTAQMAIRASLTGHLVLSTIHTNSAWGTISRLVDMGIPAYLLSSTVNLSVAQRLIRLLCHYCKKEVKTDGSELPEDFINKLSEFQFKPVGCPQCYFSGYKGRSAIYEVLYIDRELSEAVKHNQTEITGYLKKNKIETLAQNAWRLFNEGQTSLEEIYPYLIN